MYDFFLNDRKTVTFLISFIGFYWILFWISLNFSNKLFFEILTEKNTKFEYRRMMPRSFVTGTGYNRHSMTASQLNIFLKSII